MNQKTRIKEKRTIYTGEPVDAQLVSFKKEEVSEIPLGTHNVSCMPNPFKDETIITFHLDKLQSLWVEILNINGAKIKTLMEGIMPGGIYKTTWYGDDEKGKKVNKGVYFYKIKTGNGTVVSDKIILIK
ncbi:MAG: T9SS type A sorting domain-containing protein [Bacteroidales bacterium]